MSMGSIWDGIEKNDFFLTLMGQFFLASYTLSNFKPQILWKHSSACLNAEKPAEFCLASR